MKKLLLLTGLVLATNVLAGQLTDFNQVKAAIIKGESIRIGTEFSKCTNGPNSSLKPRYTLGMFTPNEVIITDDGSIKTSLQHFTLNDRSAPGKPVYQYVVYTMSADNNVHVSVAVLDAVSYEMIAPKESYVCSMAEAAKIYKS